MLNMYIYGPLLHNTMTECRLIDVYLGNSTRPLNVDFSTKPLMSTFTDISTQRVKHSDQLCVPFSYIINQLLWCL